MERQKSIGAGEVGVEPAPTPLDTADETQAAASQSSPAEDQAVADRIAHEHAAKRRSQVGRVSSNHRLLARVLEVGMRR